MNCHLGLRLALSLATGIFVASLPGFESASAAPSEHPPEIEGADVHTYKSIDDVDLKLWVFRPDDGSAGDRRPAIVFFFGGGWSHGTPNQFVPQARYLASRGMVAAVADYRVASRHGVKAVECVRDAKSAVRWIRSQADELGVDPDRIVAAGGSAGGHIAACTGTVKGYDEPDEDASVSSRPNAMVLFNPAATLANMEGKTVMSEERLEKLRERVGTDLVELSPAHHVDGTTPPAILLFGDQDRLLAGGRMFHEVMKASGRPSELKIYSGYDHGFFNPGRDGDKPYRMTLHAVDRFLESLGYLEGEPAIESE